MLDSTNKAKLLEKVEIVIIRPVRAKKDDEAKIKKYKVGDEETFIRKYSDELVSMRKAVLKGSPDHKAWLKRTEKVSKPEPPKKEDKK